MPQADAADLSLMLRSGQFGLSSDKIQELASQVLPLLTQEEARLLYRRFGIGKKR